MAEPTDKLTRFRLGGLRWVAEPWLEGALRERIGPNLGRLEQAGASLVKRSTTRAVYRLELGGRAVFVKHHLLRSLAERLKYLVLRSRAASEWAASRALAERGIPAARAVAVAERRAAGILCEAVLITEDIAGARPLSAVIGEDLGRAPTGESFRRKRRLLRAVAELVRQTHESDVFHRDLHGGNILVRNGDLFLIDLHRVSLGPVSVSQRAANLGQLLAYLPGLLSPGDRMHVVRSYLGDDFAGASLHDLARAVGRHEVRFRERRYASRAKRCVKRSTRFRGGRIDGLRAHRRVDIPADQVVEAIRKHRTTDRVLKQDHRSRVTVVDVAGRPVCVKEFIRPGLLQRLGALVCGSKARRAWLGAHALAVRGMGTPPPLAIAEAGGRSYFITEFVEGAAQFKHYVAERCRPGPGEPARRWHRFVRRAAEFVRRLHDQRVYHRDLSAKNILVCQEDDDWQFLLVDTSDVRRRRAPSLREKVRNLGQLGQIYVQPARSDRLRFYRQYTRGRPQLDDPELLEQIDAISRARHEHWLESDEAKRLGHQPESDQ
ncbi:MAG: lipopolysaccharide kinase InaA family protein [Planctomycetota bacterium]